MKNSILTAILFFLSAISLYSQDIPTDTDGDGRINLSKPEHFIYIVINKDYELDNDIDASVWGNGKGYTPRGTNFAPFTGGFDGQGHKIINLTIKRPGEEDIALLGVTKGNKKLENIIFENCTIIGGDYVGCLASKVKGNQIENCYVSGRVEGAKSVGGLIATHDPMSNKSFLNGCHANVTVISSGNYAGGLVSYTISPIINCSSAGSVKGISFVGGLVGANSNSPIQNSYSESTVIGRSNVAGLIGFNSKGTISNSYTTGNISGDTIIGGLVGKDYFGTITNSYSVGNITGKILMGGLVGYSDLGIFTNSFWDRETSGKIKSFGGISKTTYEMKTKSTFTDANWDFDNVWNIDEITNNGYPYLRQTAVSVEMESNQKNSNILVYPNPTINKANLKVTLLENTNISVELWSLTGYKIKSIHTGYLTNGEHNFDLDFSNYTNGIYSILIYTNDDVIHRWIVIQK